MYIKVENKNQVNYLAKLAKEIWMDYFESMFEKNVLEYLFEQVQSKYSILNQIEEGYLYHFIKIDNKIVGYFGYKVLESELFLSKLYILSSERRKGIGKQVIKYLEEICREKNIAIFSLTVFHKNSGAIKAYEKTGFKNMGLINRDIGNGIIIKDYKMEKEVKPTVLP